MLPKKYRLPVELCLGKRGRTDRSPLFSLKSFPAEKPHSRFGVVVGKKVAKTAVERNRIRRLILDVAGSLREKWPVADYLIIVNPACRDTGREEIYGELIQYDTA